MAARASATPAAEVPGLRPVPAARLHLTLAFLGALAPERLPEVGAALTAAARGRPSFGVTLDRLGRFPAAGRPTTIWLGLGTGRASVERLAEAVRIALERCALDFDHKPARPHLTIARVLPDASAIEVRALVLALERARVAELRFEVRTVEVIESLLTPRGPRYAVRSSVPLEDGP